MIRLKNEKQIDGIRKSCKMLSSMYRELIPQVKEGIRTIEIDRWVYNWIIKAGGKPAFLGYGDSENPFPGSICISVNNEVIHGIPSGRRLAAGDFVGLDCGIDLGGFISDQTVSVEIGRVAPEVHKLSDVTRECLYAGIGAARAGERLHQISRAVQTVAKREGYGIVHQYCGHGVGFDVHEDPAVANIPKGSNPRLMAGMVLAIEPMINLGTGDVNVLDDGWTVVTADGKISAHWEHTIAVFADHTEILTDVLDPL
ncbi:MAG: type I methionyl aminopeptidase [Treponema sp.]|nr:type I methionyl aminopeptidase [Treponema sp.]